MKKSIHKSIIVHRIQRICGFTLVELLVVLGLFSSIATLSLGTLFNAQTINGRLQETQAILDNINLSSQTIVRDIRFGSEFYCGVYMPAPLPLVRRDCAYGADGSAGGHVLIFKSPDAINDKDRVSYYVKNGILYKDDYPFGGATTTQQMTSDDVNIISLIYYVEGAYTSDGSSDYGNLSDLKQPLITLLISGVTKPANAAIIPTPFNLETVISVRDIDNK